MLKKWLIVLSGILTFYSNANAQKIKYGAKAGINFVSISAYNNPTSSTYQSKAYTNISVGGIAEADWNKLSIQTGLMLDGKGGENTYINPESSINRRKNIRLYYLQVQVNFLYRIPTKSSTLFFGGGPYAAYGLGGNYTLSGIIFDSPVDGSQSVYFGNNENSDFKRADYGLNLRAEIRFLHGIGFELNFEYGFRNIGTPNLYDDVGIKTRNRVLGIAVSYLINNN
jgi:hypothetical protein